MIGEWRLDGAFSPGTPQQRLETGTQRCAFIMGGAYVRCDRRMLGDNGQTRELVTFHNYNRLYGRYEHLFVASNWPTKVIGRSGLQQEDGVKLTIDMSFVLPDGRTEQVRSVDHYKDGRLDSSEQLRVGDGEWRSNYHLIGTRVGK